MRKFFGFCIAFLMLAFAVLQTEWMRGKINNALVAWGKTQGLELTIGSVEGLLPLDVQLRNVEISSPPLSIASLKMRLDPLKLLRGQLGIRHIKIDGGTFHDIPFEATAQGLVKLRSQLFQLSHLWIESPAFQIGSSLTFSLEKGIREGAASFSFFDLSKHFDSVQGSISGQLLYQPDSLTLHMETEELKIAHVPFSASTLSLQAEPWTEGWQGAIDFGGGPTEIPTSGHLVFSFLPQKKLLQIEEAVVQTDETSLNARFSFSPTQPLAGLARFHCTSLAKFTQLFPDLGLGGQLQIEVDLAEGKFQGTTLATNFYCLQGFAEKLEGSLDLTTAWDGAIELKGSGLRLPLGTVETFTLKTGVAKEKVAFDLHAHGQWKEAFEIETSGEWSHDSCHHLSIDRFFGFALKKPFALKEPLAIEWDAEHFKLYPLSLEVADGQISGRVDLTPQNSLIKLSAQSCPLDFLSLFKPDLLVQGTMHLDLDLIGWEKNLQGHLFGSVDSVELALIEKERSLFGKGTLQVHIDQELAQLHSHFEAQDGQFIDLSGSFPILSTHFPYSLQFDKQKAFSSTLTTEGKLEDWLAFVNIGPQRIHGWLAANLIFSHTLEAPHLLGSIDLSAASYENDFTGTFLKNIDAKLSAHKRILTLDQFKATDGPGSGTLTALGSISLDPEFSFEIAGTLDNLETLSTDPLTATFTGNAVFTGNQNHAHVTGDATVNKMLFTLAEELPDPLPELTITFVNAPDQLRLATPTPPAFSLILDTILDAPKNVLISGRGLSAELQGKLHIKGSFPEFAADGSLSLIKGDYTFAGRVFSLTQGELYFQQKPTPSAYISLTGSCSLADATATVNLRGPLSAPRLSLQSIPPLPTSDLIARILFNKNLSEISPVQALQIAQTVLALSGQADVLDMVRKTLHIDRLTLLSSESNPNSVSLQVGKYLMRGVLLSLIQGAATRQLALEVELAQGFLLKGEVSEDQQGKLSLKWHHHY